MQAVNFQDIWINLITQWLTPHSTQMQQMDKGGVLPTHLRRKDNINQLDRISELLLGLDLRLKENSFKDVSSDQFWMLVRKINHAPLWSIWGQRSLRKSDRKIWTWTNIYVYGRVSHSIMFMMRGPVRSLCMKIPPSKVLYQYLKGITQQFWLMDRQEQVKHILWKALSTTLEILKEVLFQGAWRKYSNLYKCNRAKTQLLWWELVIYRFTTK